VQYAEPRFVSRNSDTFGGLGRVSLRLGDAAAFVSGDGARSVYDREPGVPVRDALVLGGRAGYSTSFIQPRSEEDFENADRDLTASAAVGVSETFYTRATRLTPTADAHLFARLGGRTKAFADLIYTRLESAEGRVPRGTSPLGYLQLQTRLKLSRLVTGKTIVAAEALFQRRDYDESGDGRPRVDHVWTGDAVVTYAASAHFTASATAGLRIRDSTLEEFLYREVFGMLTVAWAWSQATSTSPAR
jgi:hypothetical protein